MRVHSMPRPLAGPAALGGALALTLALSGCSFTKVEPAAEEVEVLEAARVTDCERLGETRVSVAEKLGFIPRHDNAVREDLDNLARNSAADMGGDTVSPVGQPRDGKQTYGVYDCVDG